MITVAVLLFVFLIFGKSGWIFSSLFFISITCLTKAHCFAWCLSLHSWLLHLAYALALTKLGTNMFVFSYIICNKKIQVILNHNNQEQKKHQAWPY